VCIKRFCAHFFGLLIGLMSEVALGLLDSLSWQGTFSPVLDLLHNYGSPWVVFLTPIVTVPPYMRHFLNSEKGQGLSNSFDLEEVCSQTLRSWTH
jgi:hypothetical protein